MSYVDGLSSSIRSALCAPIGVTAVPHGYHVETGFVLPDHDMLSFYVVEDADGELHLEDDGTTLPDAIGRGFDMNSSSRAAMLQAVLGEEGARYDADLVIRSERFDRDDVGRVSLDFVAALIRMRDLFIMNRENVAASFADDVRKAIAESLPPSLVVEEKAANEPGAPDMVLRDKSTGLKAARIFAAGSDLRLMDALVEHQSARVGDSAVIAVVDRRRSKLTEKRFNRALNQGLEMAAVDDGTADWVKRVIDIAARDRASA